MQFEASEGIITADHDPMDCADCAEGLVWVLSSVDRVIEVQDQAPLISVVVCLNEHTVRWDPITG